MARAVLAEAEAVRAGQGPVAIMVASAGIAGNMDYDPAEWQRIIDILTSNLWKKPSNIRFRHGAPGLHVFN